MRQALITIVGMLLVSGVGALAQQSDIIRQRQALMKDNQEQVRSLSGMARGQAPFSAPTVQAALQRLERNAAQIPALFPENSFSGETNALPVIQERKADFDNRAMTLARGAQSAAAVTDQASLQAAVQTIGQSCGSCHETYRKKMP